MHHFYVMARLGPAIHEGEVPRLKGENENCQTPSGQSGE